MHARRALAYAALAVGVPGAVVAAEVQAARTGQRLDDEHGQRPRQQVVRPGEPPLHVVWLGDSTTTGVGAADFRDSMAWRVAEGLTDGPVVLTVLGRSGDQVHEVLDHQVPALADVLLRSARAHLVVISIGANDVTALTRRPTFDQRYRAVLDRVGEILDDGPTPAQTVVIGIPDLGTAPRLLSPLRQVAGFRASQLDDVIQEVAGDRGLHRVELADTTGPVFAAHPDLYFARDRYHPCGAGHGVWADAVVGSIRRSSLDVDGLGR